MGIILHCPVAFDLPGRTVTTSEPACVSFSPVRIAGKTQQRRLLGNHPVQRPDADPAERHLISAFNTLQQRLDRLASGSTAALRRNLEQTWPGAETGSNRYKRDFDQGVKVKAPHPVNGLFC